MSAPILIVEDNPDNLKLVSWMLEDHDKAFESAVTGEECLQMISAKSYSLVLLDISLPGIDGKEVARRIRANAALKSLPLVACTAHAIRQEEEEILASGVNCIVTKPIDETRLMEVINRLTS